MPESVAVCSTLSHDTKAKVTAQLNGERLRAPPISGHAQPGEPGHLPACLEVLTRAFRMHNATQPPPEPCPLTPSYYYYCTSSPLVVPQKELSLCSIHVLSLVIVVVILILVQSIVSVLQGNLFVLGPLQ